MRVPIDLPAGATALMIAFGMVASAATTQADQNEGAEMLYPNTISPPDHTQPKMADDWACQ